MPSWVEPVVSQLWSFIAVALAVMYLGQVSKRVAERMGWRHYRSSARDSDSDGPVLPPGASWYDITLRAHPLLNGALFGLLPLPTLNVIDALGVTKTGERDLLALIVARCAWFMLAGALSGQVYELIKFATNEGRTRIASVSARLKGKAPDDAGGAEQ